MNPTRQQLQRKVTGLTARLREAEEALAAIWAGDVDAIVVSGKWGERVFSLGGADFVYRLIVESMQEAALTATPEGSILFCNRQFGAMLKLPQESLPGRKLADLVAPEDHPMLASLLKATEAKPVKGRLRFIGPVGGIPSHVAASFLPQQVVPCVCIVAADLTDLEAAAADLRRSNTELRIGARQLRRLASQLTNAEERERRRLATILHDGLQQLLVGAQLQMDRVIQEGGKKAVPRGRKVAELLSQSIELSRSLASEISPPIQFGSGLVVAFEWLARSMHVKHSLEVRVKVKGAVDPAGEEISILLYRSVQELLLNVVKHAGVKTADLRLVADGEELRVSVQDLGRGFDLRGLDQAADGGGFGLFSIRERLSLVGGRLEVQSEPGRGSGFTVVVPLSTLRPNGPDGGKAPAQEGPAARPGRRPVTRGRRRAGSAGQAHAGSR